jgi:hypothetical protein
MSDQCQKLLRDLTLAKAVFQMRTLEAVLCADARSKHDQETRRATPAQEGGE